MPWDIQKIDDVVVARMSTNPVNKINKEFFADVHELADVVAREHPARPVVLASASPKAFCAGLDFEYAFPIFASGSRDVIRGFVAEFREIYFRLFTLPNPVIAAVDGPTIAGGFILLCCCDYRIASRNKARFAVNEVPLGIPMPAAYTEIVRHAVGSGTTDELILSGRFVDSDEALRLGVVHEVVDSTELLPRALDYARTIAPESLPAYRTTKKILREPVIERGMELAERFDTALIDALMSEEGVRAREHALARLKQKK